MQLALRCGRLLSQLSGCQLWPLPVACTPACSTQLLFTRCGSHCSVPLPLQCEKLGQTIIFVRTRETARSLHAVVSIVSKGIPKPNCKGSSWPWCRSVPGQPPAVGFVLEAG